MHGLFGGGGGSGSGSGEPWQVDVLTLEHLFSGEVDAAAQKWGWCYLQAVDPSQPARALELEVSSVAATGAVAPVSDAVGRRVSFARGTALVAVISRGPAADAVWDKWNNFPSAAAEVLVGPYRLTGAVISPDGTASTPLLNIGFGVRDATIERVDGAGAGFSAQIGRGILSCGFVHGAWEIG